MSNYKYTFFDNQTVGVDHLNEITSRLVSGGISAVYSGADFNVSEINNSNMAVLTGGVVPGSDINLKVTAISGGRYLINPGLCFFNDGTTMEVLSGGEEIIVPLGSPRHIYLTSDKNQMKCYPEMLDSQKQSGEFVYLAVINADGSITDKRTYARGKVPGFYASTDGMEVNVSYDYGNGDIVVNGTIEIPVGEGNFKHLCITGGVIREGWDTVTFSGVVYSDFENSYLKNLVGATKENPNNMAPACVCHVGYVGTIYVLDGGYIKDGKLVLPVSGSVVKGHKVRLNFHLW